MDTMWKFTSRKDSYVFVSRHEKPDFVAGMTDEEINEEFIVEEIPWDEKYLMDKKYLMGGIKNDKP